MKKNVLKETITIFVVIMLVLSTIVIAEIGELDHDVGVSEILSPTSGPMQIYDVEVKVKNYGSNFETTDVYVEIIELAGGTGVYAELIEDVDIDVGQETIVSFPANLNGFGHGGGVWRKNLGGKSSVAGFQPSGIQARPGGSTCPPSASGRFLPSRVFFSRS